MGAILSTDIICQIGHHMPINEIFRLSVLDKSINTYIKSIYWWHLVDCQTVGIPNILHILENYHITRLDISHTMVQDEITFQIPSVTEIILRNCFMVSDSFLKNLPNCKSFDLTNCINITGSFLNEKSTINFLKLSGCLSFDYNYLLNITMCSILDLTDTRPTPKMVNIWLKLVKKNKFYVLYVNCEKIYRIFKNNGIQGVEMYDSSNKYFRSPKLYSIYKFYGTKKVSKQNSYDQNFEIVKIIIQEYIENRNKYLKSIKSLLESVLKFNIDNIPIQNDNESFFQELLTDISHKGDIFCNRLYFDNVNFNHPFSLCNIDPKKTFHIPNSTSNWTCDNELFSSDKPENLNYDEISFWPHPKNLNYVGISSCPHPENLNYDAISSWPPHDKNIVNVDEYHYYYEIIFNQIIAIYLKEIYETNELKYFQENTYETFLSNRELDTINILSGVKPTKEDIDFLKSTEVLPMDIKDFNASLEEFYQQRMFDNKLFSLFD